MRQYSVQMVGESGIANEQDLIAEVRHLCFAEPTQALERCQQLPTHTPARAARRLTLEAMTWETIGDADAAERSWLQARHLLPSVEPLDERLQLELLPALVYWQHGLNQRALDWAIHVREQARQRQDVALEARALNLIGHLLDVFDDYAQALEMVLQALPLHRQVGNIAGESHAHFVLGIVYFNQGMKEQSLEHLEEATRLAFLTPDRGVQSTCLKNLAESHAEDFNRYDHAEHLMRQALTLAIAEDNKKLIGEVYLSMGRMDSWRGLNASAVEHMERALSMMEDRSAVERLTDVRLGIVKERLKLNDTGERTLALLQRGLKDATVGGTKMYESHAHHLYAQVFELKGDHANALHHMKTLRTLERELHDERAERRFHQLAIRFDLERAQARADHEREQRERLEAVIQENAHLLEQLQSQTVQLEHLAMRDPLTGLHNRRAMNAHLEEAFTQARSNGEALCVVVLDVDHFKNINDRFSHAVGDDVLRSLASIFGGHVRTSDLIARAGGEEFVCAFRGTALPTVLMTCERLRLEVQDFDWSVLAEGLQVTVSMGVADDTDASNVSEMLSRADKNLYNAKHQGRNRVC